MDRAQERLALIELLDRDGRCLRALDVWRWPLTIGRALDNDLVLDDPCVAARHATLVPDEQGELRLQVDDTVNGVTLRGRQLARGTDTALPAAGAELQLGHSRLRLRLRGETLAAERLLPTQLPGLDARLAATATVLLLLALGTHWVSLDPGADTAAWLPLALGLPVALVGWCGLWALLSKLFQHRFDFVGHLRIALPWLLGVELVDLVVPQVAASFGWPTLWQLVAPSQALLVVLMLREHLAHLLPLHPRAVGASVAAVALVAGGVSLTMTLRANDSFSRSPYMSTLPLPALDFVRPAPPAALVQDLGPLAAALAARVKESRQAEEADGADAGDGDSDGSDE